MQIGYVTSENYENNIWLKGTIRAAGMRPFDFKMAKVKEKKQENSPDYEIYLFVNNAKEKFRQPKIGALWKKQSETTGEPYMSGHIESPAFLNGTIYIAITKAKPFFENENVTWLYDILWSAPNSKSKNSSSDEQLPQSDKPDVNNVQVAYTDPSAQPKPLPATQINDDEIPF